MEALMVLAGITAVPIFVSVVLAFQRQWTWIAAVAGATAVPLQLLGLTSTCTQGADGTFGTGAIFSTPFLLVAIGIILWAPHRQTTVAARSVTALVALAALLLTRDAWVNTLLYQTPCGEVHAVYPSGTPMVLIILAGYLILPSLLAVCAAWTAFRAWRSSASLSVRER